jgi:hypothetical protein
MEAQGGSSQYSNVKFNKFITIVWTKVIFQAKLIPHPNGCGILNQADLKVCLGNDIALVADK